MTLLGVSLIHLKCNLTRFFLGQQAQVGLENLHFFGVTKAILKMSFNFLKLYAFLIDLSSARCLLLFFLCFTKYLRLFLAVATVDATTVS